MVVVGDSGFCFSPCAAVVRQTVPRRTPLWSLRIVERFFILGRDCGRAMCFRFYFLGCLSECGWLRTVIVGFFF